MLMDPFTYSFYPFRLGVNSFDEIMSVLRDTTSVLNLISIYMLSDELHNLIAMPFHYITSVICCVIIFIKCNEVYFLGWII